MFVGGGLCRICDIVSFKYGYGGRVCNDEKVMKMR